MNIRLCKKCGNIVTKSECNRTDENGKKYYPYQCINCDEDLFEFETELYEPKKEEEETNE